MPPTTWIATCLFCTPHLFLFYTTIPTYHNISHSSGSWFSVCWTLDCYTSFSFPPTVATWFAPHCLFLVYPLDAPHVLGLGSRLDIRCLLLVAWIWIVPLPSCGWVGPRCHSHPHPLPRAVPIPQFPRCHSCWVVPWVGGCFRFQCIPYRSIPWNRPLPRFCYMGHSLPPLLLVLLFPTSQRILGLPSVLDWFLDAVLPTFSTLPALFAWIAFHHIVLWIPSFTPTG